MRSSFQLILVVVVVVVVVLSGAAVVYYTIVDKSLGITSDFIEQIGSERRLACRERYTPCTSLSVRSVRPVDLPSSSSCG
jgi:hypothetical protein